jgi:hypothetical protein
MVPSYPVCGLRFAVEKNDNGLGVSFGAFQREISISTLIGQKGSL